VYYCGAGLKTSNISALKNCQIFSFASDKRYAHPEDYNIRMRCFINMEKIIGKIFYFVKHLSAGAGYNHQPAPCQLNCLSFIVLSYSLNKLVANESRSG